MQKALESDRRDTWERCCIWHVIGIPPHTSGADLLAFCDPTAQDGEISWISDTAAYVVANY